MQNFMFCCVWKVAQEKLSYRVAQDEGHSKRCPFRLLETNKISNLERFKVVTIGLVKFDQRFLNCLTTSNLVSSIVYYF